MCTENEKEKTVVESLQNIKEQKDKLDKWNDQLQKKQEMIRNLLECKDREIESLKQNEKCLSEQVEELNSILEKPWKEEREGNNIPSVESSEHLSLTNKRYE